MALLVGTAIAIWLLVRPTGEGDGSEVAFTFTPSPAVTDVETEPTRTTPEDTTPAARRTTTPTGQSTPQQYVVQEGDTLTDIAAQFAPPGVDPFEYAQEIADASGLASVEDPIEPGDTLTLP
ncbi:MAG: LysM peptidoglycan-binding domain-containing protein [Dehalococcoidia bacterium]|nr:LysM peptidoglycan-binding domain-containing protein [Dehalococcoidia bacterium]